MKTVPNRYPTTAHAPHQRRTPASASAAPARHHVDELFVVDRALLILEIEGPQQLPDLLAANLAEEGPWSTRLIVARGCLHCGEHADEFAHFEHPVAVYVERSEGVEKRLRVEDLLRQQSRNSRVTVAEWPCSCRVTVAFQCRQPPAPTSVS